MSDCSTMLGPGSTQNGLPLRIEVDLWEATRLLESAAQAPDQASCTAAISGAAAWLSYAAQHYTEQGGDDGSPAQRVACARDTAATLAAHVPADPAALVAFQRTAIGPFVGVVRVLVDQANTRAQDNTMLWAVVGAYFGVTMLQGYINYKQTNGGYGRGPRGTITPVTQVTYPNR